MSQIYHKFRVPSWVVQLIRGLAAWFIAMHSLTIHHLLAPLIILAKDNYTAQRCTAERNANSYLTTWTTTLGGEGETSVQVWPQHYHWAHVCLCVCVCAYMLRRLCIWVHIQVSSSHPTCYLHLQHYLLLFTHMYIHSRRHDKNLTNRTI